MRNAFGTVAIISLFLFSCKKEKSFDPNNPNGGGGGTGGALLAKTVTQLDGGDSLVVVYNYDNQKRFIGYIAEESYQGDLYNSEMKFIRNAQGIIQKVVLKSYDLVLIGIDSIFYVAHYNAGTSRYTSKVLTYDDGTDFFRDSTAFSYNSSGKIIGSEEFYDDGNGYVKASKIDYTYGSSGNITREKAYYFDDVSNSYVASYQDDYEYDSKVNPMILGNEAFLFGESSWAASNNQTKDTFTDLEDPSGGDVYTTTYTYNSNNKPLTDQTVAQSDGVPYPTKYTYK
jgi:hypothetical protein